MRAFTFAPWASSAFTSRSLAWRSGMPDMGSSKPYTGFAVKLSHWLDAQCRGVKPAAMVVGIGAMIQQEQREVHLASHHRHQQWSVAECADGLGNPQEIRDTVGSRPRPRSGC